MTTSEHTELVTHYKIPIPRTLHRTLDESEIAGKRLFIIGDVHGCYDELEQLLTQANITRDNSVCVFCGDIVNKGPKSCETLAFVRSLGQSALSVRGNHEEKVIFEALKQYDSDSTELSKQKYAWVKNLSKQDIAYLKELPYTISIPSVNSIVVHAGLEFGKPLESQQPVAMTLMRNVIIDEKGCRAWLEGRSTGVPWASQWPGPQHIYFGHDAVRGFQDNPHATGLDTGCVYGGKLTGVSIDAATHTKTYYSVEAKSKYSVPND